MSPFTLVDTTVVGGPDLVADDDADFDLTDLRLGAITVNGISFTGSIIVDTDDCIHRRVGMCQGKS